MRPWMAAIIAMTAWAGCADSEESGEAFSYDTPTWTAGDISVYDDEATVDGSIMIAMDGTTYTESMSEPATRGTSSQEVLATQLMAGSTPVYVGTFSTDLGPGAAYIEPLAWRHADLGEVAVTVSNHLAFGDADERPPLLPFPLKSGGTGSVTDFVEFIDGPVALPVHWEVAEMGRHNGPAGSFDVVIINIEADADTLEAEMETMMRAAFEGDGMTVHSVEAAVEAAGSTEYAPAIGQVVEAMIEIEATTSADVSFDGERAQLEISIDMTLTSTLQSFQAGDGNDLTEEEIIASLGQPSIIDVPDDSIPDDPAPGDGPTPVDDEAQVNLAVALDASRVALEDQPVVMIATSFNREAAVQDVYVEVLDGADELVGYSFLDIAPDGTASISFAPDLAGRYHITAYALDAELNALDEAEAELAVTWSLTAPADCDQVVAAGIGGCDGLVWPVGAGADSMTVTADIQTLDALGLPGTLTLDGPDGYSEASDDGTASITIEDPPAGDWAALFTPELGVLAGGSYSVEVDVGDPSGQDQGEAAAAMLRSFGEALGAALL